MFLSPNFIQKCWRLSTDIRYTNLTTMSILIGTVTANTYRGRRSDLEIDDKSEIKQTILALADNRTHMGHRMGTIAYQVAAVCGVSKEWARKLLIQMEKDGLLECREMGQLQIYYKK